MKETINRNMLKHHVSTAMFCKYCKHVLDVKRAVSIDLSFKGELRYTEIMCAPCFDKRTFALGEDSMRDGFTFEVLDGRALFGRKRKA